MASAWIRLNPAAPIRKFCHSPSIIPSILNAAVCALKSDRLAAPISVHSDNNFPEKAWSWAPHISMYLGRDRDSPQKAYQTLIFLRLQIDGLKVDFIIAQSWDTGSSATLLQASIQHCIYSWLRCRSVCSNKDFLDWKWNITTPCETPACSAIRASVVLERPSLSMQSIVASINWRLRYSL